MPALPRSIGGVLVVGVGDPKTGKFIEGRQSRQDVSTLRQIALRLRGEYHDGNEKHLRTDTIVALTKVENTSPFERLTRREYALAACALGGLIIVLVPLLLQLSSSNSPAPAGRPGRVQ